MAKGRHIMGNQRFTSDMVGAINGFDGGSSLSSNRDRKGGAIMNNRSRPSNIVGGFDIIGNVSGRVGRVGAADISPADHAKAAATMDARIAKVLKPSYRACYELATTTRSKDKYETCAVTLLLQMGGEQGITSMITTLADVQKEQFGDLVALQRAMVRRLAECNDFMNQGWFKRMLAPKGPHTAPAKKA